VNSELVAALKHIVGDAGFLEGEAVGEKYYSDWRGQGDVRPEFILRPGNTEELSEVMKLCHAAGQSVVAQGGMTGLVAAARPTRNEIPVSFERMTGIDELDVRTGTMTVQSGTPLQVIQEHAEANGFIYPLDLGARGSCTIGGNLATNAGGNRVIRFGMTRDLVLGVEAVLADGTIVSSLNKLIKNNTGYDLKQLFIGSEGTLGLITKAVLRLAPKPESQAVAFCAVADFDAVAGFLHHMKSGLGGNLSAFEVIWQNTYQVTLDNVPGVKAPLGPEHAYYVLTETMGGDQVRDPERFEAVLGKALEDGLIVDAVISKSESEIDELWRVRDSLAEALASQQPAVGFDVSLLIDDMEFFAAEVTRRMDSKWGGSSVWIGGHLGDGNLHLGIKAGSLDPQPKDDIDALVYGLVGELKGSVSAEHGIGTLKKKYLASSRNPAELTMMHALKQALDPKGLLGAGRIFEIDPN
jgi:FAD/FMN-containing dehydrogenase